MSAVQANQKVGSGIFFMHGSYGLLAKQHSRGGRRGGARCEAWFADRPAYLFLRFLTKVSLICALPCLALARASSAQGEENSAWNKPVSVTWSGAQLRDSLYRFADAQALHVLIDRRVDPSSPLALTADRVPAEETVRAAAERSGAKLALLDGLAYIGPEPAAKRLATVAALRTKEAQSASTELRKKLLDRQPWQWDDFAAPRELLAKLGEDASVTMVGAEQIPHDLWAAAKLPPLTLVERLTVLLQQFDLTYRIGDDGGSIVLEPLPERVFIERDYAAGAKPEERLEEWRSRAPEAEIELRGKRIVVRGTVEEHAAMMATSRPKPRTPETPQSTDVYTLKVDGEPLNKILPPLAKQLRLELVIDEPGITARGIPLDYRVTFEVKQAPLKELMDAVFQGTQLAWRVENGKLTVTAP